MIRRCHETEMDVVCEIINSSARAYEGHIPADCYSQPYMPIDELASEIEDGVVFHGYQVGGRLVAVMGIQDKGAVTLIRHAYTRSSWRGRGIGTALLRHLLERTAKPVLIGTWRDATWAIEFYHKFGFRLVSQVEKDKLLREYWSIPDRQVETSVVLADKKARQALAGSGAQCKP